MEISFSHMLETRVWAATFAAIPFVVVSYVLVRLAREKKCKEARDQFWRPIVVLAELASALGVVATIAVAAQYFVKGESESLQESLAQATAKRQGGAFLLGLTSCGSSALPGASFRELSAMSQLCAVSRDFTRPTAPPLDAAIIALKRLGPVPADIREILSPQVTELGRLLQAELEASSRLHLSQLQARVRPGESDCLVIVIAVSVLVGATLKFSRSVSEWSLGGAKA